MGDQAAPPPPGGTRLTRMLKLLEVGSTPEVRRRAAKHVGDVAGANPAQLPAVLSRLGPLLRSRSWDTRVAAAAAVGFAAAAAPHPTVDDVDRWARAVTATWPDDTPDAAAAADAVVEADAMADPAEADAGPSLSLASFSVDRVLSPTAAAASEDQEAASLVGGIPASARQRNRLKRKARGAPVKAGAGVGSASLANAPLAPATATADDNDGDDGDDETGIDGLTSSPGAARAWPCGPLAVALLSDLLSPTWETRHGAAAALGELLAQCAASAGVRAPPPVIAAITAGIAPDAGASPAQTTTEVAEARAASRAAAASNAAWSSDAAARLLCVLALDRFGDYGADAAVGPARESAAMALAMLLASGGDRGAPLAAAAVAPLCALCVTNAWPARQAGALTLKYLLPARPVILPSVQASLWSALGDDDEDVRCAAAEALAGVTTHLAALDAIRGDGPSPEDEDEGDPAPRAFVDQLGRRLWWALRAAGDLDPSTAAAAHLLAQLHGGGGGDGAPPLVMSPGALAPRIGRLWPLLRHRLSGVRRAALTTLDCLLRPPAPTAWLATPGVLAPAVRALYQSILTDDDAATASDAARLLGDVASASPPGALLAALLPHVRGLLRLGCTPPGAALDTGVAFAAQRVAPALTLKKRRPGATAAVAPEAAVLPLIMGGEGGAGAAGARLAASSALGRVLRCALPAAPDGHQAAVMTRLLELMQSPGAAPRQFGAVVIATWLDPSLDACRPPYAPGNGAVPHTTLSGTEAAAAVASLNAHVHALLGASDPGAPTPGMTGPYAELSAKHWQLRAEASAAIKHAKYAKVTPAGVTPDALPEEFGLPEAATLLLQLPATAPPARAPETAKVYAGSRAKLAATVESLTLLQASLHGAVTGALACAAVALASAGLAALPAKLQSVIAPTVAAVRRERDGHWRGYAARAAASLVAACASRGASPNDKVVRNVCTLACSDVAFMARGAPGGGDVTTPADSSSSTPATDNGDDDAAVARIGAEAALGELASRFGPRLFEALPSLWDTLAGPLVAAGRADKTGNACGATDASSHPDDPAAASAIAASSGLLASLHLLSVLGPKVHPTLAAHIDTQLLAPAVDAAGHAAPAARSAAARACAALAASSPPRLLPLLLPRVLPLLADTQRSSARCGAACLLTTVIAALGDAIAPYAVVILLPLMARMADADDSVRSPAAAAFAALLPLLPLAQAAGVPPGLPPDLAERCARDGAFLEQLLDNARTEGYALPAGVMAPGAGPLRSYQQEGINWLAFLRRFGLHGVLADDMGLGKTVQTLASLGAAVADRHAGAAAAAARGVPAPPEFTPLPSLVVCPATLTSHWLAEADRWLAPDALVPRWAYVGSSSERAALRCKLPTAGLVVTSYEALRSDTGALASQAWCYVVLDEGHVIRNASTAVAQAAKRLRGTHRLVLSGTPIQNNLLELWSLFDYLMPGMLSSERAFNARYARAVKLAALEAGGGAGGKSRGGGSHGSAALEAALASSAALHKQLMPFILRRTKAQVLKDLPAKVLQDLPCDLSPLQRRLYDEFEAGAAAGALSSAANAASRRVGPPPAGAFAALSFLRKLCSHPVLVLDRGSPGHVCAVTEAATAAGVDPATAWDSPWLASADHSPKLLALRQLLMDCGVGAGGRTTETDAAGDDDSAPPAHRVLIFAQLRAVLDLVESAVLAPLRASGGASWLRLDGSVPPAARGAIVRRFNRDPTVDALLLTTAVGGLGLNLTAADVVIFVEHDWNPMVDLQAMDRAHRLGQTRQVHVYRLVARGTLEDRVLGLQAFKLAVAGAVVTQDNVSMDAMDTGALLDLLGPAPAPVAGATTAGRVARTPAMAAGVQGDAPDAAGEDTRAAEQYEAAFSLDAFLARLQRPAT